MKAQVTGINAAQKFGKIDKSRWGKIQELGWTIIPIIIDDVRRESHRLADRIASHLQRPRMVS